MNDKKKQIEEEAKLYEASYYTHLDQHSHQNPSDHFIAGANFGMGLNDEWISVEDLPKEHLVVLVFIPVGEFGLRSLGYHVNKIWYNGVTKITTRFSGEPTHYQYLPSPPKKTP